MSERNPYLVLGVDFGASKDEARRRFALAARRTRRQGGAWSVEDLNWALHEIEARESNPADDVDTYRVPANRVVFEPVGSGLFAPEPTPLPRRTAASSAEDVVTLTAEALGEIRDVLLRTAEQVVDLSSVVDP
jgi:hypothetical protein